MTTAQYDSRACSVARTASFLGQRWTLVILRDLMNGVRRFDELQAHLGVARDILSSRLEELVTHGLVEKVPYREPGARTRTEYRLTEAGWELRTIMISIMHWGDKHLAGPEGPPMRVVHASCGDEVNVRIECAQGHDATGEVRLEPGPGAVPVSHAKT